MTIEQARAEFYQLLNDDVDFADMYENSELGFLAWSDDYQILTNDLCFTVVKIANQVFQHGQMIIKF